MWCFLPIHWVTNIEWPRVLAIWRGEFQSPGSSCSVLLRHLWLSPSKKISFPWQSSTCTRTRRRTVTAIRGFRSCLYPHYVRCALIASGPVPLVPSLPFHFHSNWTPLQSAHLSFLSLILVHHYIDFMTHSWSMTESLRNALCGSLEELNKRELNDHKSLTECLGQIKGGRSLREVMKVWTNQYRLWGSTFIEKFLFEGTMKNLVLSLLQSSKPFKNYIYVIGIIYYPCFIS